MNKEYIQAGQMFIVNTDKGLKKVDRVDNMTKILETENNIEVIENLKKQNNEKDFFSHHNLLNYVEKKFLKKLYSIGLPIIIIITIITAIISNIYMALALSPLCLAGIGIISFVAIPINLNKCNKLNKNMCKNADTLLNNELEKQKQKIKELHIESKILAKNDLGILGETIKINRTKLIDDLKRKLELIEAYQLMKKDLMKFSKDYLLLSSKLKSKGYSKSDVEFIQMLMEQDIKEEEKQKTLNLKKNKR